MKRIVVLILSLFLFALAIYFFVLEKPIDHAELTGSFKSESGDGFDVAYRSDGTFAIQGKGIKTILTTVTKKLTGKDTGLSGRYEVKYNPFMGSTIIMESTRTSHKLPTAAANMPATTASDSIENPRHTLRYASGISQSSSLYSQTSLPLRYASM